MRLRAFYICLTMGLLFGGCFTNCSVNDKKHSSSDNDAAIINGISISKKDLDALHKRALKRMQKENSEVISDEIGDQIRSGILRKMLDDEILKQIAKKEGVAIDRIERVEALEQHKSRMGGSKGFEAFLSYSELTEEQFLETIVTNLLRQKLIDKLIEKKEPSNEEIEKYYHENKSIFTKSEMVRARHILFKLSKEDPSSKEKAVLKKVRNVIQELKNPKNSFSKAAEKYSECPSASQGGDLGFFARGQMVKPFEDASFSALPHTVVGPIKTGFGYHLIYVEEKSPEKIADLSEVRGKVVEYLSRNNYSKNAEKLLSELRKKADIVIYDSSITLEKYLAPSELSKMVSSANKAD